MVVDISFLASPIFIFWAAFVLIAIAIVILTKLERKIKRRIIQQQQEEAYYNNRIENVKKNIKDPSNFLIELSSLTQDFLVREFKVERDLKYSQLIDVFRKKGKKDIVKYCEEIQQALYAGTHLDKENLEYLLKELVFLIRKQKKFESAKQVVYKKNKFAEFFRRKESLNHLRNNPIASEKNLPLPPLPQKEKIKEEHKKVNLVTPKQQTVSISQHNKKNQSKFAKYQEYVKSIDNLDRVKEKLIKSGKPLRF